MRVRHNWANKAISSLVAAMIISCVWYVWHNRPRLAVATPASYAQASGTAALRVRAEPLEPLNPTIQKLGDTLQFSVATTAYPQVQKVEFYVENQFVGTAYSPPYSVAVSESSLVAGAHQLTAKIFTSTTTAQSQPAAFTTQSDTPSGTSTSLGEHAVSAAASADSQPPASVLPVPANLNADTVVDGTSIALSWDPATGAIQYQVWRDNSLIATIAHTTYSDTGLNPGQTYDYYIVAADNVGDTSLPSQTLAVTTPTPQDISPVNTGASNTSHATLTTGSTDTAS
jgi:hypothetical protein